MIKSSAVISAESNVVVAGTKFKMFMAASSTSLTPHEFGWRTSSCTRW
ncbi:MAG: hypothetical protein R2822_28435 [Spirosomataceae bacterium]